MDIFTSLTAEEIAHSKRTAEISRILAGKRKIVEDSSGKSKAAIFRKWQPLSAYRLSRFPPWETSFWRIAMRKSFQQEV